MFKQGDEVKIGMEGSTHPFKVGDKVVLTRKIPVNGDTFLYTCRLVEKPSVSGMVLEKELFNETN